MRRWKKTAALALCALVLAGALSLSASASPGNVNLMAVNERVLLDLTADNMPRTVGGVLYVPYTMLSYQATGIDLGVNAMYSTQAHTAGYRRAAGRGVRHPGQQRPGPVRR